MNVLILTGNGREHALAAIYAKSKQVKKVVMIPGNGLTEFSSKKIKNYHHTSVFDFEKIVKICKKETIDFVDISQDEIIAKGYVDKFNALGIDTFGPTKKAAQIEWDKAWSRDFMQKYHLPIPLYQVFTNRKKAEDFIKKIPKQPLFIKAAGLAGGKGAVYAPDKKRALDAIMYMSSFGKSGEVFLIEECLTGKEFSLFAICDGKTAKIIATAQDHKTVYNANQGLNTGGMGCVSPISLLNDSLIQQIQKTILDPFMKGMQQEERPYSGILYVGGILTPKGIKIIEFNARWGDPEAQVILPSIKTDYVRIVMAVKKQKLHTLSIQTDKKIRMSIAACVRGYPGDISPAKGKKIFGLREILEKSPVLVYGAGIIRKGNIFLTDGGRIFHVVAEGKNIGEAREKAYGAISKVYIEGNNLHYRTDIGWQEIEKYITTKTL